MNTQELIQEAAVIRDERNQYANTAERVGTALVHMAEQIAAQGADVDKIEADVRGTLTLSQLDNPLGFTTNAQWGQGLNEDKPYTFRLVDTSGRCIGHVWLLNDADGISNSSMAARLIEVAMCCAAINEEGALTTDARWGSPRLYYRTFCTPLSGGTPDGGLPAGIFKWSAWQEYRDYVAKPIKDALAALQQQHATDVADLQAKLGALSNMWLEIEVEFTEIEDLVTYFSEHPDIALNDTYKFFSCRISNERSDYNVFGMKSVRPDADKTYAYVGLYIKYGERYDVLEVAFYLEDGQWFLDETVIYTPVTDVGVRYEGERAFLCKYYSSDYIHTSKEPLNTADTTVDGLMSAAHVQKLNNLESRIAALEAKSK